MHSPWNLILYQDGIDASDGLAKNHSRKTCIFYWSFKEFGMRALAHEQVWGIVTNVRVDECKVIDGGVARVFEKVLDEFFGAAANMAIAGATMRIDGSIRGEASKTATIYAKVGIILADIPALKEIVECIGHSGMKFCCLCMDCVQQKSDIPLPADHAVNFAQQTSLSRFKLHSNGTIKATVRRVNALHDQHIAGALTQEEYRLRCQMLGWSWTSANILLNARYDIRLADVIMYDWAHCYVHDGLADNELGQCMKAVPRELASFEELGDYVAKFTFPKCHPNPDHLFDAAANRNNRKKGSISCTGSEFLTLAPIVHRYFAEVVSKRASPEFKNHALSMVACCAVVMMLVSQVILALKADELAIAISAHIELYLLVYGAEEMRPKHHYVLHLPHMLRRFGFLFSTFVHERKRRLAKRYMQPRRTLKSFERGVMEDITCHQIWELEQKFFLTYEATENITSKKLRDAINDSFPGVPLGCVSIHTQVACMGGRAMKGDVVSFFVDGTMLVGELLVTIGVKENDNKYTMYSMIALWRFISQSDQWANFDTEEGQNLLRIRTDESLRGVHTYRKDSERVCLVHIPELK